jgi:uroporphyrinogen decarboxylase
LPDACRSLVFAGSPWTVATYMIEGGGSREFTRSKALLASDPLALHRLLEKLARATTDYLNAQVEAGAQAVMIFDTWGGVLSTREYLEFSLAYMERIAAGLQRERDGRRVPLILFTKGGGEWLASMAATGADALGIDWTTELSAARRAVGDRVALQGNLDPAALLESPEAIRAHVARVLESYGRGPGHVFNLGHGIRPGVDPDHVAAMVAAVHDLSPACHAAI